MTEDNDTTADEAPEETPVAEDAPAEEGVEETPAADVDAEQPVAEQDASEAAPPAELTRREQRAAARHAEASGRPPRTAQERHAERLAARKLKAAARARRRAKAKASRPAERGPQKTVSTVEHGPGRPKVRQGLVVSDRADKTITVRIESARRHRRYEKIVRGSSTLHAHDEANDAHIGDLVRIVESRPLSRLKRWRLLEVLERAK